ncbi:MAG: DUF1059 domain-containing protein [Chloroflexi bacterium]|nr:DUF1059 domain-containing protein [Chloroflexota bacterium]
MPLTLSCADMGYTCGYEVVGDTMEDLLKSTREHAVDLHNVSEEIATSPEKLEEWKGAIKQTSRPPQARTSRPDDPEPH